MSLKFDNKVSANADVPTVATANSFTYSIGDKKFYNVSGSSPGSIKYANLSTSPGNLYISYDTSAKKYTFGTTNSNKNGKGIYGELLLSVVVPAREQYTVNFGLSFSSLRTASIASSLAVEVFNFGYSNDTVTAPTLQSTNPTFGYYASGSPYSIFQSSNGSSGSGTGVTGSKNVTGVVYKNESDTDQTFVQHFGFWTGLGYGSSNYANLSGSCTITPTITDVQALTFDAPQDVTATFNGNDLVSTLDAQITDESWFFGNAMTLSSVVARDKGTYTITVTLKPSFISEGKIWDLGGSTTSDPQTFELTINQKTIKYTLADTVTANRIYGVTDVGKAYAVYSDIETSDVGTAHGPDLELTYLSTDTYGYNSTTAPTEAGNYKVTVTDKNASTSNYNMVYDATSDHTFTIAPKSVNRPAAVAALTYNGEPQTFTVNNYDSAVMDYGVTTGGAYAAGTLPTGMTKGTAAKDFEATNAGKYDIEFKLQTNASGVVRNYVWDDSTNGVLKITYEISPKTLEFKFNPPNNGTSWRIKLNDTGAVGWAYATGGEPVTVGGVQEEPVLQYYYYYQADGASTQRVLAEGADLNVEDLKDAMNKRSTGIYVIGLQFAKDANSADYPVNLNYALGTSAESSALELTAGEAGIDGIGLAYTDSTMGPSDPLQPLPAALSYAFDSNGNPVAYFLQPDFDGTVFEIDGTPSYAYDNGSTPSYANGLSRAGKVTVTVNIKIKASEQATNKMPTSYTGTKFKTYSRTDDYNAVVTFEYTIDKMEIDTTAFKMQYSYDQSSWKDFATSDNKVEFANAKIYVRIDPASLEPVTAGISVMFGTKQYAEEKNKGVYTANANFTLTDNDNFTIQNATYNWEITNKQINVTNWVPGDFTTSDGVEHVGEIMVINGHSGLYPNVIEYVYTWSDLEGHGGTGTGLTELDNIFAVASPTNQVTVTATVQLKAGMSSTYDLTGSVLTSQPFVVGDAKSMAIITNAGSAEYGSVNESAFGVKVEADGDILPATNPHTQALLYEVYLHDYDGLSVDNVSGDGYGLLSSVDYSALNAGKYVIEVRLTAAGSQDYAPKGARQLFEITPKKIVVPQVTKDIVYNGGYINLADYLDGNYNADIMSMLSGYTNKLAGSYTVTFKLLSNNYMWVEPTTEEPLSNKLFGKTVLFADGITIDNSALTATLNWTINKITLSTDGWKLESKDGVSLNALAAYQELIDENGLDVAIGYRYYDTNGNLIEEPVLKGGDKYIVEAYLTGEDAANFEFADGTDEAKSISAQKEYTVPQSGFAKLMGSTVDFLKANWLWLVIAAAALIFLIILICIIVSAKKKKRKKEELAEQRRLEKEEREREEKKLEREERMARMNQQQAMPQMMMPQMMPPMMPQMMQQQMPQQSMPQAAQPMASGGGSSNEIAELKAEILALKTAQESAKELAEIKAEQAAMKAEATLRAEAKTDFQLANILARLGGEQVVQSGISLDKLTELIRTEVNSALDSREKRATAPAAPESSAATPVAAQVPPDAVMTTVTTTKIDTTKKPAQTAQTSAPAPAPRTVVRNFVAPMPVDDGRVFDVGGFYTPADPITDLGIDEDIDKKN
ncbi:MAG: hypothetical protein K2O44_05550 [Clostridia bacterium]|nr:hypothetical protein [Clostridia bacterium]